MAQYANREETWYETSSPEVMVWPRDWRSPGLTFDTGAFEALLRMPTHDLLTSTIAPTDAWVLPAADVCALTDDPVKNWEITQDDIPAEEPYRIIKPVPVKVEREREMDFTATFEAGNVSIGGETFQDAFQSLVLEIMDTLDSLLDSDVNLGPGAKRQLRTLGDYIVKTDNTTR